ncbi:MAG: alpha/beta hydrolase [Clostridia bacterium]|nr:alpha/beta hydrolase [Clostridia bacterium]
MENIITKGLSFYDAVGNLYIKGVLKRSGRKSFFSSAEVAKRELERMKREYRDDIGFPIDPKWKTFAGRELFCGYPLYRFQPENRSGLTVLYIHGGGFVNQPDPRHFQFADRFCAESGARVLFPIYPKAPVHGFKETYALIEALYRELLNTRDGKNVVFMGDSAGAMLCVTVCGELSKKNVPLPKKLVLYSLVADAELNNPEIGTIEPRDPMQGAEGLREYIRAWAGEEPITSPLIDPMAADLSVLPETILFSGTDEIFCPDVRLFAEKAHSAGADVTCYLFSHMYHCFHLFDLRAAKTVRDLTREGLSGLSG